MNKINNLYVLTAFIFSMTAFSAESSLNLTASNTAKNKQELRSQINQLNFQIISPEAVQYKVQDIAQKKSNR